MADKAISELVAASSVTPDSLFVLQQDNTAKKLTAQVLENWLLSLADGHGGIQSSELLKTVGLVKTYRFTLADQTYIDIDVVDGRGIESVKPTSTVGLVVTYTVTYNDGTTSTFNVTNGAKGDKGDRADIWVKYASQKPTASSHSFGDVPDSWIGIATGHNMDTAPTDWQQYTWFQWKGEKGDTGDPATLISAEIRYNVGDSGTIMPSGSWSESVPPVTPGKFLWTRQVLQFNTGAPITSYSISRFGIDGTGSVSTVAGISPDATGNVPLKAADVKALPISGGTMEGPINMNGQKLSGLNAPTEDDEAATKGSSESYTDSQIRDRVIYSGGKNLLKIDSVTHTSNGITFTANENGRFTATGTATSYAYLDVPILLPAGDYVLSRHEYKMFGSAISVLASDRSHIATVINEEATFSLAQNELIYVRISASSGSSCDNEYAKIMIRLASETDATYEPYYEGLADLTTREMKLLWENASPDSAFATQTILLNLTGFWGCIIITGEASVVIKKNFNAQLRNVNMWGMGAKDFQDKIRACSVNENHVWFADSFYITNAASEVRNTDLIPVRIYGIKGVIA